MKYGDSDEEEKKNEEEKEALIKFLPWKSTKLLIIKLCILEIKISGRQN